MEEMFPASGQDNNTLSQPYRKTDKGQKELS